MPCLLIDSLDDPRLEPYRHLKRTNVTRWQDLLVAEGVKLVERLLASPFEVLSLLVAEERRHRCPQPLPPELPVYLLPEKLVHQLVGYQFHHGVMACARRRPGPSLADLCGPPSRPLTLVVCSDVQDTENLGAMLRTGQALGIDGVVLGPRSADPWSRRVLRVSMGASLRLPIVEVADCGPALAALRGEHQVELWATVVDSDAVPLAELQRPRRLGLLFGSEGHGLQPAHVACCDRRVRIPMQPGVDSLNVAMAAGVFLYEVLRRSGPA
jgi:tRNA G18 (ribose-2'-O)-methylase SpoU